MTEYRVMQLPIDVDSNLAEAARAAETSKMELVSYLLALDREATSEARAQASGRERKAFTIRAEDHAWAKSEARRRGMTMTAYVEGLVRDYLGAPV